MPDEIDRIVDREEEIVAKQLAVQRSQATIVPGTPGECRLCGEESPRLVGGVCAPCRDLRGLP